MSQATCKTSGITEALHSHIVLSRVNERGHWHRQSQSPARLWLTIIKSCVHTYVQSGFGHIKTVSTFPAPRELELDEHMARALSIKENPWVFSELSGFVEVLFWWSCGNLGTGGLLGSVQCWTPPPPPHPPPSIKAKCYFSPLSLPHYSTCFPSPLP